MRPQSAKAKGRKLQQEICRSVLGSFAQLEGNDVRSCSMGANGTDVILSPLAKKLFPYDVECKNCERLNVWGALEQAAANTSADATPILAIKRNHHAVHAVVPWDAFMELVRRAHGVADPLVVSESAGDPLPDQEAAPAKRRRVLESTLQTLATQMQECVGELLGDAPRTPE